MKEVAAENRPVMTIRQSPVSNVAADAAATAPSLRHPRVFSSRRALMQKDRPNESAGLTAHEADGIRTRNHRIDSPEL